MQFVSPTMIPRGTGTLVHDPSFYPSLMNTLNVKVFGKADARVYATHDHGTANHELRHMIDASFLRSLEGGTDLEITNPQPPCTRVELTKTPGGDRVQGMLKEPLPVSFKSGQADQVVMYLDHVLVIDSLPVPLHISVKALQEKEGNKIFEWLNSALRDYSTKLKKSLFPTRYHSHAYWTDDTICCGSCAFASDTEYQTMFDDLVKYQGNDTVLRRVCAACNSFGSLSVCRACNKEYYCSKECQVADWPRHKPLCAKKPRKARTTNMDLSPIDEPNETHMEEEEEPQLVNEWLAGLNLGETGAQAAPRAVGALSARRNGKGGKSKGGKKR